jgi:hypothetical protein
MPGFVADFRRRFACRRRLFWGGFAHGKGDCPCYGHLLPWLKVLRSTPLPRTSCGQAVPAFRQSLSSRKPIFRGTWRWATLPSTTWPRVSTTWNQSMCRIVWAAVVMALRMASSVPVLDVSSFHMTYGRIKVIVTH